MVTAMTMIIYNYYNDADNNYNNNYDNIHSTAHTVSIKQMY